MTAQPTVDGIDITHTMARARSAQQRWSKRSVADRAAVLLSVRDRLHRDKARVVATLQQESGKNYEDAQADFMAVVAALTYWTGHAEEFLADRRIRATSPVTIGRRTFVAYDPIGVVGIIGPWNFPLTLTFGDAIPALLAGNAVVMKPSEHTPQSNTLLPPLLDQAGAPPDTLQVLSGGPDHGAALVDAADALMFTGSVATGRRIGARAGERLIPCTLELGGKDAMLVLADADLDRAAAGAAFYGLANAGQVCMSIERILVEDAVYDDFLSRLVAHVRTLRTGTGRSEGQAEIGPLIAPSQAATVRRHIDEALAKGARIELGGHTQEQDGRTIIWPTVLSNVDPSMSCMSEETFGPTLPVMRVRDADEAVRIANGSEFGLTASVWTRDHERGLAVARRLEAGVVLVNDAQVAFAVHDAPFGGVKASGVGRRHGGADGIRKFCRTKTVQVPMITTKSEPLWFPYTARSTRMIGRVSGWLFGSWRKDARRR